MQVEIQIEMQIKMQIQNHADSICMTYPLQLAMLCKVNNLIQSFIF